METRAFADAIVPLGSRRSASVERARARTLSSSTRASRSSVTRNATPPPRSWRGRVRLADVSARARATALAPRGVRGLYGGPRLAPCACVPPVVADVAEDVLDRLQDGARVGRLAPFSSCERLQRLRLELVRDRASREARARRARTSSSRSDASRRAAATISCDGLAAAVIDAVAAMWLRDGQRPRRCRERKIRARGVVRVRRWSPWRKRVASCTRSSDARLDARLRRTPRTIPRCRSARRHGPLVARNHLVHDARRLERASERRARAERARVRFRSATLKRDSALRRAPVKDAARARSSARSTVSNAARVARELEPGVGIFDDRPGEIGASKGRCAFAPNRAFRGSRGHRNRRCWEERPTFVKNRLVSCRRPLLARTSSPSPPRRSARRARSSSGARARCAAPRASRAAPPRTGPRSTGPRRLCQPPEKAARFPSPAGPPAAPPRRRRPPRGSSPRARRARAGARRLYARASMPLCSAMKRRACAQGLGILQARGGGGGGGRPPPPPPPARRRRVRAPLQVELLLDHERPRLLRGGGRDRRLAHGVPVRFEAIWPSRHRKARGSGTRRLPKRAGAARARSGGKDARDVSLGPNPPGA